MSSNGYVYSKVFTLLVFSEIYIFVLVQSASAVILIVALVCLRERQSYYRRIEAGAFSAHSHHLKATPAKFPQRETSIRSLRESANGSTLPG